MDLPTPLRPAFAAIITLVAACNVATAQEIAAPAASYESSVLASTPASLDRSSWNLPAAGPAVDPELSLWSQEKHDRKVDESLNADPLAEPSVLASIDTALGTCFCAER